MTTTPIPTILTALSLTVYFDGSPTTILRTDPAFPEALKAYKAGDFDTIKRMLAKQETVAKAVSSTSDAAVEVRDETIYIDGEAVSGTLHERMLEFLREQLPFQPLVEFLRRLRKNPSFRAQEALYGFMETNKHPILEDGTFLAYKRVKAPDANGAMWDIHTGNTNDNRPGKTLTLPRNKVNEDPNQTCSYGLHVANWDYAANHFGGRGDVMVEVKVDPEHVVAIPVDYNQSKMRVSEYVVLKVVEAPNPSTTLIRDNPGTDCDPTNCPEDCDCREEEYEEDEDACTSCGSTDCSDPDFCKDDEEEENGSDDDGSADNLLSQVPTDSLRALMRALLDSNDPKDAQKLSDIADELSARSR